MSVRNTRKNRSCRELEKVSSDLVSACLLKRLLQSTNRAIADSSCYKF
jgi:hypothetical protein